ncbi:AAA family ATPase [Neobacillus rhizophilus]|uniref:AAA family ATPase n=1 Tax=Neobacillus rhizophilus TaxID=2833579 RepID=A0A942U4Q0_9BACI|nr:AAA family ATPase [Neobacillus rhizophilus]MBS4212693.1 AAA family ATPase [Neobacillus rhizophilus]
MEVLYIWIGKYKNINNQGFNFGGELTFQFESGKLKVTPNPMHIPGFFNIFRKEKGTIYANILNVTGIAGENGTGKSNFLEFLKHLSTYKNEDYLICYKLKEKYFITGTECQIIGTDVEITRTQIDEFCSSNRLIYLSNILDITRNETSNYHLYNVSTNYLVNNEGFDQFRANEFLRQIQFSLDNNFSSLIDFKLPHKIICKLIIDENDNFDRQILRWSEATINQKELSSDEEIILRNNIKNLRKLRGVLLQLCSKQEKFICYNNFIRLLITVFWKEILELPRQITLYLINRIDLFNELIEHLIIGLKNKNDIEVNLVEDLTINAFKEMFNSIEDLTVVINMGLNSKYERKNLKTILNKWKRATRAKIQVLIKFTSIFLDESSSCLDNQIKIPFESLELQEFTDNYSRSIMKKNYLQFEWTELSTGQVARLNIYSRLHYAMKKLPKNIKDIVIIIDEGELYFHPEWQRKWLWYILRAISLIFTDRNVQVIQTTHSPFVLSDLPNHNVIFLKKGKLGAEVIDGLEDNQLTFASNIHMLLSNSFFMENGLVGEVAKSKINQLIKILQNKDVEEIRKNEFSMTKQLRYIGEPIVRNKLFSMLDNILTIDYLKVNRRLDAIEELLNKRGKND